MTQEPSRKRKSASERRAEQAKNPFRTQSASQRRAEDRARTGKTSATKESSAALSHDQVVELLNNPTKTVTEAELRDQYGYVLADLKSMGILTAGLLVLEVILALVLPQ
jgi:hypothetical protein